MSAVPLDIEARSWGHDPAPTRTASTPSAGRSPSPPPPAVRRRPARAADPPAVPGGGRGGPGRRLGGARPGLVVHQRDPAPAGARPGRRAVRDQRPPGASSLNLAPQPGETAGFSPQTSPRGAGPARARTRRWTWCSPTTAAVPDRESRCARCRRRELGADGLHLAPAGRGRRRPATARPGAGWPPAYEPYLFVRRCDVTGSEPMAMTAAVKDELARLAGHQALLPQGRGLGDAAVRRRAAHRQRPHRGRGGARHRRRRAPAAQGHRRDLRAHLRGRRDRARRAAPGSRYVVRVVKDGEALARQTGLLDGRGRPVRGPAAAGRLRRHLRRGGRLARRVPRPRLAHRAGPLVRAGGHLPRPGGRARAGRAPPAGSASRPRRARCAASTGSSSATATRSARC